MQACLWVGVSSVPAPPGGYQNKVPRVFSDLTSKYHFKEYRPQCPEKLYLWDFVCQESQSSGQPKKKGRKKKIAMWPLYGWLYDRAKTDQTQIPAHVPGSDHPPCVSARAAAPVTLKEEKPLLCWSPIFFCFWTTQSRPLPRIVSSEHADSGSGGLLPGSNWPPLPSTQLRGDGVRAASNPVLTKGF